jgi:hypothetical protein
MIIASPNQINIVQIMFFFKEDQMESLMMLTYGTVDNFIPFASSRYSFLSKAIFLMDKLCELVHFFTLGQRHTKH